MRAVDLFAGPGGWATGLRAAGITDYGFEWDFDACRTRKAAGHHAVQADVTTLDPARFADMDMLVASPPCQTFSKAGSKTGHLALDRLLEEQPRVWAGADPAGLGISDDLRDWAVLYPAWWAGRLRPEYILLEQVPAVKLVWGQLHVLLEDDGYSVWSGVLNAADFGVPQTRERAFLIASRVGDVARPTPSHARHPEPVLFGDELAPWVSMAEALGWGGELNTGRNWQKGGDRSDAQKIPTTEPAPALTAKSGGQWIFGDVRNSKGTIRGQDEPAPTITASADNGNFRFVAGESSTRLQVPEAAILQSFPASYPFQGTKTSQFRQVGDAVPPLMALVLGLAVQGIDWVEWRSEQAA